MKVESILDLIGSTPLVNVSVLSPHPNVRMYMKLEGQNPSGSIKDRVALSLIDDAEQRGELQPGGTILESSSGNTGIGLALVAQLRGYRVVVVVADNVTRERTDLLKSFGAEIIYSPGELGSNGAIVKAKELKEQNPDWVLLYQYGNEANSRAHEQTTGPEILADCPEIDVFIAGLGTSGTLMGVSRYLKKMKPEVSVVAVEPPTGESVTGLRSLEDGFIPEIFHPELIDRKIMVRSAESIHYTRELLLTTGLFVGVSTGAVVAGAVKVAKKMDEGTIVMISPDSGWKYLSAGIWVDNEDDVVRSAETTNYW